jgi:amino acid adenylation domain-containing protein
MFIQDLIASSKQRNPSALAIEYGAIKKSYGQLEAEITALVAVLSTKIEKADIVAVYMPVCPELIVSMLAIMQAGGIFLPIDPAGHHKENSQKLAISSPVATLTLTSIAQEVELLMNSTNYQVDTDNTNLTIFSYVNENGSATRSKEQTWRKGLPDDVGYLYFTSGSTGIPKGVLGRLNSLRAFIEWESELVGVTSTDRVSLLTPQTFDPFLRDVFLPLANGATLCIPAQQLFVADSHTLCEWLNISGITISHVVPSVFDLLLDTFSIQGIPTTYTPHTLLFAGEPLTPVLINKLRKNEALYSSRLINLYGTTESTLAKCANIISQTDTKLPSFPVGRPMTGVKVVFRNDDGVINSCFTEGEICFAGDIFSHGYFIDKNQPIEPTSELMLVDGKLQRICPTGDLGQLDNAGQLVVRGRKDNQVKINGKRVELAEIENALESSKRVAKAVVVIDPSAKEMRLIAWVILSSSDAEFKPDTLIDFLYDELESHKIPQQIFSLEKFPLSAHGKVDRKRLAMNVANHNDALKSRRTDDISSPQSETQKWLVTLYKELLQCDNIDCSDSFTRLGGRSMQALKALFKINQHFDCRLTMGAFMRAQTISAIACIIDRHCEENKQASNTSLSFDDKMLISHQRRLCFFQQRFPQSVAYNMTYSLLWCGVLEKQRLQSALTALIGNHTELRTRFYFNSEGHFSQEIPPQYQAYLKYTDVSTTDDAKASATSFITEQAKRLLSVDSGEPYCFSLIKLKSQKYIFVMTLHHIVADEWSVEQLFSEWIDLYVHSTPPENSKHNDTFTYQRVIEDADIVHTIPETCKGYWLEQLEGVPPSTILPADFKSTANKYKKSGMAQFSLPVELTQRCSALAEKLDVSLFSFMLSAFYLLLHKYTSQTDLAIGTPVTGRTKEEAIGFMSICFVTASKLR